MYEAMTRKKNERILKKLDVFYNRIRTEMLNTLARYCVPIVRNILFGVANMDYQTNYQILSSLF